MRGEDEGVIGGGDVRAGMTSSRISRRGESSRWIIDCRASSIIAAVGWNDR
jgi:hypothetical protein